MWNFRPYDARKHLDFSSYHLIILHGDIQRSGPEWKLREQFGGSECDWPCHSERKACHLQPEKEVRHEIELEHTSVICMH